MRKNLQKLRQRYRALKPRERLLVVGGTVVVVGVVWFNLVYNAVAQKSAGNNTEIVTLQTTLASLRQQQATLQQQRAQDPNLEEKQRLQRTQEQLVNLDVQLKEKLHTLIAPQQMAGVLEAMLQQNAHLQLQRVQSMGAKPLLTEDEEVSDDDDKPAAMVEVYRHSVEIEFTGSYLATLAYLTALQSLPWDFYWDAVRLEVDKYPNARVVITVHTLSLREGWIGV
jgi:MSHA biogenesis protein MshJ